MFAEENSIIYDCERFTQKCPLCETFAYTNLTIFSKSNKKSVDINTNKRSTTIVMYKKKIRQIQKSNTMTTIISTMIYFLLISLLLPFVTVDAASIESESNSGAVRRLRKRHTTRSGNININKKKSVHIERELKAKAEKAGNKTKKTISPKVPPTASPTIAATTAPTRSPTLSPSESPMIYLTNSPTDSPTASPNEAELSGTVDLIAATPAGVDAAEVEAKFVAAIESMLNKSMLNNGSGRRRLGRHRNSRHQNRYLKEESNDGNSEVTAKAT